jgi:C-terminal processing protease CtpA/Prc
MRWVRWFVVIGGVAVGASCGTSTAPVTPTAPTASNTSPSAAVSNYLNAFINIAQNNSINRQTIDWTAYRAAVFAEAGAAQTIGELNPAIRVAITLLRDGHSSYRSATGTTEQANAFARQIQDTIASRDRDDLIGWIVDLRSNGGGNMWPMIAGLGPILGEGPRRQHESAGIRRAVPIVPRQDPVWRLDTSG